MRRFWIMALLTTSTVLAAGCQCGRPWGSPMNYGCGPYGAYSGNTYYGSAPGTMVSSPTCCDVNYRGTPSTGTTETMRSSRALRLEPMSDPFTR